MATSAEIKNHAKQHQVSREAARNALMPKFNNEQVYVMAVRHHGANKTPEFFSAKVRLPRKQEIVNGKAGLLKQICVEAWLHNAPVASVAEYLVQTKTYTLIKEVDSDVNFFFLEFYECDPERPGCYSCRDIAAATCENEQAFRQLAVEMIAEFELDADSGYSIVRHD